MIRPPPLRFGDVVRVVAPSSAVEAAALERGLAVLRDEWGLIVRHRADVTARRAYLAGDDARRAEEWLEAARDVEARALFCARGGYGAMRILPQVDAARLLHPPKWLVGFSDVTVLHAAANLAGLVTVHGPLVTTLGRATPAAKEALRALLFGGGRGAAPGEPPPGTGCAAASVIRPGRCTGTLLGGSLAMLGHLCGTRWMPPLAGAILFFEDVAEKPYKLDRYLTQLRLAGALEGVRGVCVGHLTACDDGEQRGADTVREIVLSLGVPAIEGVPAGHHDHNIALPLGALATLVAPGPGEAGPPRLLFEGGGAL